MMQARILMVDDDRSVGELVAEILGPAGYAVTVLSRVEEAEALLNRGVTFDLAILDVVMPGMTGDELARVLRRRDPDAKILFLTGFSAALFQARPVLWAGEAFLEKPFTPRGLEEAVSLILYGHTQPTGSAA
jgi:two-component system, cell cycle sensor histidine kinase and response regulator CckA